MAVAHTGKSTGKGYGDKEGGGTVKLGLSAEALSPLCV